MKYLVVFAAVLSLGGCATADLNATLDTLAKNYAHCERTVNYTATVGPINPASGAMVSGTVHCPAQPEAPVK